MQQSNDNEGGGPLGYLDSPLVTAVLSTFVVSIIAYLIGRLRNVSQTLKEIPTLQANDIELKKNMKDIQGDLDENTNLLKNQLEKLSEKMDRRFDLLSEKQSVIERDTNEKIVNLLMTLRNFSGVDQYTSGNSNINLSNNNPNRGKYKE